MPTKAVKKGQPSGSQGPPIGLLKALEDTGRVRGSSATPRPTAAVLSPSPAGGKSFQEHIEKLQNMSLEDDPALRSTGTFGMRNSFNGNASDSSSGGIDISPDRKVLIY